MSRMSIARSFHPTRIQKRLLWQSSVPLVQSACFGNRYNVSGTRWLSSQPSLQDDESWSFSAVENHERREATQQQDVSVTMNQTTREEKQLVRDRQNAAKAVPFWLDNDIDCFQQTMNALNLDLSVSSDGTKRKTLTMDFMKRGVIHGSQNNNVLTEYRQLYKDSIISFSEALQDSPETLTPNIEPVLDKLVSVGFADLTWAKHFRRFTKFHNHHQHQSQILKQKKKQYEERVGELEAAQKKLDDMLVQSKRNQEDDDGDSQEPKTLLKGMVHAVSSLWYGKESQQERDQLETSDENGTMIVNMHAKMVKKQKSAVKHLQDRVDATSKQIQRFEAPGDGYQPLLTQEEYDKADHVVRQVLQDISRAFAAHIQKRHSHMIEQYQVLDAKTDLTKPHEWYEHARLDRRKIIFHGGPTNSGKTYTALQRLIQAEKGLYLGPLRLLAAEVYETLTAQGIYTSLYTGQEQREVPFATHTAATVEMASTMEDYDVVVIDEIQMIADPFRGFAWSRALLGMRCKEIHVCGGLEAEEIVQRMAKVCGDEFEVKRYQRFRELKVAKKSISSKPQARGSYKTVHPGDCVVAFSRSDIFAIKREIERSTKHKCCVIYGSLPPETRTDQARLFNDPNSGYDILVASDAIGMGLNLNIRRVIFNSMFKTNGESIVQLDHSAVKQISGRAGRRNSPYPDGSVTCRDPEDMDHLRKCMRENVAPIQKGGLLPTSEHIQHFSEALEKYDLGDDYENLHNILVNFEQMAKTKGDFFVCRQTHMGVIAKHIDDLPLSVSDKYTLCMAPVVVNNGYSLRTLKKFAEKYASGEAPGLSSNLIPKPAKSFVDLATLCSKHSELELFLWLSARFPGNAVEQQTAQAMKEEVISHINKGLNNSGKLKLDRYCYIQRDAKLRESWKKNRDNDKADMLNVSISLPDDIYSKPWRSFSRDKKR